MELMDGGDNKLRDDTVSRFWLTEQGSNLGLGPLILKNTGSEKSKPNMVAETYEAILGTVYIDSSKDLVRLKLAIRKLGLGPHEFLKEAVRKEEALEMERQERERQEEEERRVESI
ncbi:hypothetical protein CC78DRAFT_607682 [Lojkania enalia]|uniref:RNase III domain-containing protein n=1 Tax=Lojkania enalia TaxID=147567 RepID=A0A9P4K3S2_9PLEO|nr:hypothetical protein CC78DRAFT_607682 [Didymosphaeria enalia]